MQKRIITGIIGLPVVIFLVHFGGWPLLLMCLVLSLIGLRELYRAFAKKDKSVHAVGYIFTTLYFVAVFGAGVGQWLVIALALFIVFVQVFLVLKYNKLAIEDVITTVYGFLYVPFLVSFIVLTRQHTFGWYFVWLVFTSAFGCDTFAYMTGVSIGKRKLVNTPSPSKSVEGLVGGILGAGLVGFVYGFFIVRFAAPAVDNFIVIAVVVSMIGGVASIFGDMAASAIKRRTGIKDFGNLLPGHGGVMDRADSILLVAPVVYLAVNILNCFFG
ncbi:MAG: phosphatidate cytidylyltransferase [Defluviitaleaceae bacterium]|nr:phosphatidate cytidylyltransferase [Defluviitaleaceae bacterium]